MKKGLPSPDIMGLTFLKEYVTVLKFGAPFKHNDYISPGKSGN